MKPGYKIDRYGTSEPATILVINWHRENTVAMACYSDQTKMSEIYIPEEHTVAIWHIKPKA